MSRSPLRRRLIVFMVPTAHLTPLSIANGESFDSAILSDSAIAQSIGRAIAQRSKLQLSRINHKTSSKDMWTAVQQITGRHQDIPTADGFTAEALNQHYAGISSDQNYWPPQKRHTVALSH